MGLIISLAGPSTGPAGFTSNFRFLGKLRTDFGATNINTVAMDRSVVPQRPDVEEWQSITFAVPSNLGAGSGTNTAFFRRLGSAMDLRLRFVKDVTPGSGASAVTFTMPSGYTIATGSINNGHIGFGTFTGATFGPAADTQAGSGTTFYLRKSSGATNINGADFTANAELNFVLTIPIAEWVGLYT